MLCYQLLMVFLGLWVYAGLNGQMHMAVTLLSVSSLLFQTVGVAFGAALAWFWLLARYRAADIGALGLMGSVFGVLLSAWLLDEALPPDFLIATVLILLGLFWVGRKPAAARA